MKFDEEEDINSTQEDCKGSEREREVRGFSQDVSKAWGTGQGREVGKGHTACV